MPDSPKEKVSTAHRVKSQYNCLEVLLQVYSDEISWKARKQIYSMNINEQGAHLSDHSYA